MIYQLSTKYQRHIAAFMLFIFYASTATASWNNNRAINYPTIGRGLEANTNKNNKARLDGNEMAKNKNFAINNKLSVVADDDIGGPTQPEMSGFKPVNASNMVNLFTGDFSYNIPLLDVGGYPVNIFYDGNITPEQEASWVGLGWNINPGAITRNMRGVPDDFDGTDIMEQKQAMKPNKTWGVDLGADVELVGIKNDLFGKLGLSAGLGLGVSFNNYLGPAIETSTKFGVKWTILKTAETEKSSSFSLGIGANTSTTNSSRNGKTTTNSISLSAGLSKNDRTYSNSLSISQTGNSRTGIRSLEIHDQFSASGGTSVKNAEGKKDFSQSSSGSVGCNVFSTSISFVKPSYMPAIRMPITNKAGSGRFQLGIGIFGLEGSVEATVSASKSFIADGDKTQKKSMYGYFNYEKANGNKNALLDFTRLGDREVTPTTSIISAPQYTYDVFSISGEGTGGSIRAFRNDLGYVHDNYTRTKSESWSVGADIDVPGHYGGNFADANTSNVIYEWGYNNKLRNVIPFKEANGTWENLYFRNPGENSVINPNQYNKIGGVDLVRYELGGSDELPSIEPKLQAIKKDGSNSIINTINLVSTLDPVERKKRSQIVTFFSAQDASIIGLDKEIKSYDRTIILDADKNLNFAHFPRFDNTLRKPHHISQINVTEADGKRYVYGIPVYNVTQTDFTFTTSQSLLPDADNHIAYSPNQKTESSPYVEDTPNGTEDGYVQSTKTPAYAHSFLLSGLLSPDYVDVTGDGITEDDLGNAVKFNYTKIDENYKWRAPFTTDAYKANYNPGNRSEKKDNKGLISYGERESWYTHSIESKTMIAIFTLGSRDDGKSVNDEDGGIKASSNALRRLEKIDLYSKADLKANGLSNAKPIKTVHFEYGYGLCKKTPDNVNATGGKLTLKKIFFTFSGVGAGRANKNQYVFGYNETDAESNPDHQYNTSDRWGYCKPASMNPSAMPNADYPYACQNKNNKDLIDKYAAAWNLKSILLPSGGQINVDYEADDYAFIQNKRATTMMKIKGLAASATAVPSSHLYDIAGYLYRENVYVFVDVPVACTNKQAVYEKYLQGQKQLSFKLMVNMPKGEEYLTAYGDIDDYGVTSNNTRIWVKLKLLDGFSPLALVASEYLREQLPGQTFPGYDVSGSDGSLAQIGEMLMGWLSTIAHGNERPIDFIRESGRAQSIDTPRSFVRLNLPDGYKYGGGNRVKKVTLKDNWDKMTQQYYSSYGQEYDYTTTEVFEGKTRTISSGVASYEPGVGGEENPFQTIVQIANGVPAGPTSYGAIEMPVLDAMFPAATVGYSKVTVRSAKRFSISNNPNLKSHSGIGKQVTEYYTAKDFPVKYYHTALDPASTKEKHENSTGSFFYTYGIDAKALSQGFYVETNDMHGKMKSQASYPENDETTPINYTENFYRNTGSNGLDEKFDFADNKTGGTVSQGNMGIDIELMTDAREFRTVASSFNIQAQVDLFPILIPLWIPFIWPTDALSETIYKAVTTTKTVSYHSIVDKVVVIDKGSKVSTENLVYDAETGQVIVNRTQNEFNDYIYNTSYPAYWAYSGMGLAYKNIDAVYKNVNFYNGRIVSGNVGDVKDVFESGDELYLINQGTVPTMICDARFATPTAQRLWVVDIAKNTSPLTNAQVTSDNLLFITEGGLLYSKNNVTFRIIRSGKRNMLGATAQTITSMAIPIINNKIGFDANSKVVSAGAIEYKEKWQTDPGIIKYSATTVVDCQETETPLVCNKLNNNYRLEIRFNPYVKGVLGNFKTWQNKVLYTDRTESNPVSPSKTNIAQNGFVSNFSPYWSFNNSNNLVPTTTSSQWVWNSQITKTNARGQELETKNALGIYTAALYGYSKNLPLAIASNSRANSMVFDGFEDNYFNSELNNSNRCKPAFWDLTTNKSNSVINAESLGFAAHTGKKVLEVNTTLQGNYDVNKNIIDNFDVISEPVNLLPNYSDKGLNLILDDFTFCPTNDPNYLSSPIFGTTSSNDGFTIQPPQFDPYGTCNVVPSGIGVTVIRTSHFNGVQAWGYFVINAMGHYNINVNGQTAGYTSSCTGYDYAYNIRIEDENGNIIEKSPSDGLYCLKPKVYKIFFTASGSSFETPGCPPNLQCPCVQNIWAHLHTFRVNGVQVYKSLQNNSSSCSIPVTLRKPISANEAMLNPSFSIGKNDSKKMLFSAWVKENCSTPSCTTYINSNATITFDNTASTAFTLYPKGNIIEGWQRIEGEFDVPLDASTMTLQLNNASGTANYWDDIRIHPYNANMKSYVYDPINLRLVAELDENNYAKFYEYDDEGTLIRTKAETKEGIKTITETRSAKQKVIDSIVP